MKASPWDRLNRGGPSSLPPHPATVAQPKALPPHPATVAQPKSPFGGIEAPPRRPPHAATVAQPKKPFGVIPVPPSHAAAMKANGFVRLVQRAQWVEENQGNLDNQKLKPLGKKEWVKKVKKSEHVIKAFVYEVAPGIAVESDKENDESFPLFVAGLIEQICKVPVGKKLVQQFDPKNGFTQAAEDPYKGGITVLIHEMRHQQIIQTSAFYTRGPDGAWRLGNDKAKRIPRILFPNRPLENQRLDVGAGDNPAQVTSDGVVNHRDFPKSTAPFDVMLFHELCHAHYFHIGMAPEYFAILGTWKNSELSNAVEEMLVTGLEYGRGLEFCENNYRVQKGLALRKSYLAVGLEEDENVTEDDWKQGKYVDPSYVIAMANPTGLQDPRGQNIAFWDEYKSKKKL